MINNIAARWTALVLLAAVLALTGCAAPADKGNMAVASIATLKKLPYSVAVSTRGGNETGTMDSSNVSNADLKAALESSIIQSSLFKQVVQGKEGDYELLVTVAQLSKPTFGASFTVTMDAGWSLVKASDKSVALRKSISSTYTATMSDSLIGATRMRLAVEGVVRDNIAQGLKAISEAGI